MTDTNSNILTNSDRIQKLSNLINIVQDDIDDSTKNLTETINNINVSIEEFNDLNKEVINVSQEILKINELSSNNAKSIEEINIAADNLNISTTKLNNQLNQFKS